jgi:hypothetical protein
MRRVIRFFGFWYGCLGSLCALAWYLSTLLGSFTFPRNWGIVMTIAALHGVVACFTFQPKVRPPWQPLFSVTRERIRLARVLFGLATLNFIVCFGTLLIAGKLGNQTLEDKTVPLILTSFLLQNTVYIAVHWAFRPASLFRGSFIEAVSNPLGSFLRLVLPRSKKQ